MRDLALRCAGQPAIEDLEREGEAAGARIGTRGELAARAQVVETPQQAEAPLQIARGRDVGEQAIAGEEIAAANRQLQPAAAVGEQDVLHGTALHDGDCVAPQALKLAADTRHSGSAALGPERENKCRHVGAPEYPAVESRVGGILKRGAGPSRTPPPLPSRLWRCPTRYHGD